MLAYETEALATEAEAETKGFSVETEAKTKTFSLEAEARPRRLKFQPRRDRTEGHYCASRRPRDRGVKTEVTSLESTHRLCLSSTYLPICVGQSQQWTTTTMYYGIRRLRNTSVPLIVPLVIYFDTMPARRSG